ncbi:MAG: peroxiredoxin [Candidatus Wallbacteria bacterium]|nr:peroxiredoxin [Candidatus Wallbacteria bacterium]
MLEIGSVVPDFELQDEAGKMVRLQDLLGGPLLLYFYPADFTPVCTKQACMFRDIYQDMVAAGVKVIGISPQDPASHVRFRAQHSLPFPLLSDPDKRTIRAYGADGPFGLGVRRISYLIGPDRTVQHAIVADLRVSRHETFAAEARDKARELGK